LDNIQGYLNRDILNIFPAVAGEDDDNVWSYGQEQFPQNCHKRLSSNLTTPFPQQIVFIAWLVSLSSHSANNNTKGRRSGPCHEISRHYRIRRKNRGSQFFYRLSPGDTTGGVYNAQTLFEGNNLGCFFFQPAQQSIPETLSGLLSDLPLVISLLNKWIDPVTTRLDCPALNTFHQSTFDQFPGS
jgi:hypothetical protein